MPSQTVSAVAITILSIFAIFLLLRCRLGRHTRQPYQPARARIEGGGVKRGLTPPEGAILLGRPLNLSLTLVLFELLRKGFVRQVAALPLVVEVADTFRMSGSGLSAAARGERRRLAAQELHKAMHPYEEAFLEILEAQSGIPVQDIDYGIAIQPLVRYVASRVGGYDLEDTRAYYRLIIDRAPKEARSDGVLTFERQKVFDRNFGWVLLGEDFGSVLDAVDYSYAPVWLRSLGDEGAGSLEGRRFSAWAQDVMAAMADAVAEEDVKLGLDKEMDTTTVTLMNEIARATFYG